MIDPLVMYQFVELVFAPAFLYASGLLIVVYGLLGILTAIQYLRR